jgi:hypothetical protein
VVTPSQGCAYASFIMSFIKHVTRLIFVKDMSRLDLKPRLPALANRFHRVPPPPPSTTAAPSHAPSRSNSSKSHSGLFKFFMGIFTMCQRTNHRLDIIERMQDATLKNQHLIRQKLHIEEPLEEMMEEEHLEPIDPFVFFTPDELA